MPNQADSNVFMEVLDLFDLHDLGQFEILLQCLCALVFVWFISIMLWRPRKRPSMRSVAVLVLGDVGRSPRMMYHAESFAKSGFETFVVGYEGAKPVAALLVEPRVSFCYLAEIPKTLRPLPFILLVPIKVIHQVLSLVYTFFIEISNPPEYIIVQNPPSVPTLALVWFVAFWRGCKVIIDWHNLGYTILALKLGNKHPLVRIAEKFEAFFGRTAYAHLFVTQAMHDHLLARWQLRGLKVVLHDRPPAHFHRAQTPEIHELFLRLDNDLRRQAHLPSFLPDITHPYSTSLTRVSTSNGGIPAPSAPAFANIAASRAPGTPDAVLGAMSPPLGLPRKRDDRPALVVSSTSWTPDEDFSILLAALARYEQRAEVVNKKKPGTLPKLLCVVTGKGPLKEKYMSEVGRMQTGKAGGDGWKWVRCVSLWLEPEDYPLLLGSADLGVCLHSSSSALDLPMKVVDMFGCGLPVCALEFACLHELVQDGHNGLVFSSADQLSKQLEALLTTFPNCPTLEGLQASLQHSGQPGIWNTWAENWDRVVRPLVLTDAGTGY